MYERLPVPVRNRIRRGAYRARLLWAPDVAPFLDFAPPGHFYSPLPTIVDARRVDSGARAELAAMPDVDLNVAAQESLFEELRPLLVDFSVDTRSCRYRIDPYFSEGDAAIYSAILRHFQPRRIIEVGSGFSSALLLDVAAEHLPRLSATFVEPHPQRLKLLLRPEDAPRIVETPVQDVPLDEFATLERDDILFIDSSHVVKVGSDVHHLFALVLPILRPGVLVHIHDMFWPFEYPVSWLADGRAWNELYHVHAFLQNNDRYEMLFFADWFHATHGRQIDGTPLAGGSASLWLRKR